MSKMLFIINFHSRNKATSFRESPGGSSEWACHRVSKKFSYSFVFHFLGGAYDCWRVCTSTVMDRPGPTRRVSLSSGDAWTEGSSQTTTILLMDFEMALPKVVQRLKLLSHSKFNFDLALWAANSRWCLTGIQSRRGKFALRATPAIG